MELLKYAVALTGSIGTGKSSVSRILNLEGYDIIDADKIAHKMLESCKDDIVQIFGTIILDDNTIDRKKLGNIIFNDINAKQKLEYILHPKIRDEIYKQAKILEKKKKTYFIDIPLFFESKDKIAYNIPYSLVVYAPKDLAIRRVQMRDNLSTCEVVKRMESQIDIEIKKEMADFIIENTSSV